MRFFKIPTLTPFLISKKNIRKSLLIINIGIFLSIFAASSALISLYIENQISKYETSIIENRSLNRFFNNLESHYGIYEDARSRLYLSNNTFASYNEILATLKKGDILIDDREYYLYRLFSLYHGAKEFFDDEDFLLEIDEFMDVDKSDFLIQMYDPIVHKKFFEKIKVLSTNFKLNKTTYNYISKDLKKIDFFKILEDKEFFSLSTSKIDNYENYYKSYYIKLYEINDFMFEYLSIFREILSDWSISNKSYNIENYKEVERLSNLEKQIIIIAFILQIIIFFVTQFFEISFATKIKKKIVKNKK
jgi:hypothetical protein